MLKNQRKASRKAMRHPVWAKLEDKLHACIITDISDTGARLDVEDGKIFPENFVLFISGRDGKARRYCRVMWRAPRQIGVHFERLTAMPVDKPRPKAATPAQTAPQPVAAAAMPAAAAAAARPDLAETA